MIERKAFRVPMPDGRWLAAEMAGPEDGDLLVFHCGTPGSCYLFEDHVRECAQRDLRIVCASRPGYDGSPRLKGRSHADNAADTRALLDFLEVESAYVMGHSGGGGPALADAALNPDRVRSVAGVAMIAPRRAMGPEWRNGLDANEPELTALEEGEPALRQEVTTAAADMAKAQRAEDLASDPDLPKFYSAVDQASFKGAFLPFALETRRRIQQGVEGWLDDDFAFYEDWGFELGSIRVPVSIWQGGDENDKLIPVAHAKWLAQRVPGARLNLLEEEGHLSLINDRFGEILNELIELG